MELVQLSERQKVPKKIIYLISASPRELEDFLRRLFLLTKRSSQFSRKFTDWTDYRLKSDCTHIVQTGKLLKTPKNQTYLISPTSREIEDF